MLKKSHMSSSFRSPPPQVCMVKWSGKISPSFWQIEVSGWWCLNDGNVGMVGAYKSYFYGFLGTDPDTRDFLFHTMVCFCTLPSTLTKTSQIWWLVMIRKQRKQISVSWESESGQIVWFGRLVLVNEFVTGIFSIDFALLEKSQSIYSPSGILFSSKWHDLIFFLKNYLIRCFWFLYIKIGVGTYISPTLSFKNKTTFGVVKCKYIRPIEIIWDTLPKTHSSPPWKWWLGNDPAFL